MNSFYNHNKKLLIKVEEIFSIEETSKHSTGIFSHCLLSGIVSLQGSYSAMVDFAVERVLREIAICI